MLHGLARALFLCYTARAILPEESLLSYGILFRQRTHMARKDGPRSPQIAIGKSETTLIHIAKDMPDGLHWWAEQYFHFEVTTSPASQKVQRRDLALFLHYMMTEEGINGWRGRHGSHGIFSGTCGRQ
jgi:hypothetical protein